MSRIHFCFKITLKNAIQTSGENPQNLPFPLRYVDPSNTPIPSLDQPLLHIKFWYVVCFMQCVIVMAGFH